MTEENKPSDIKVTPELKKGFVRDCLLKYPDHKKHGWGAMVAKGMKNAFNYDVYDGEISKIKKDIFDSDKKSAIQFISRFKYYEMLVDLFEQAVSAKDKLSVMQEIKQFSGYGNGLIEIDDEGKMKIKQEVDLSNLSTEELVAFKRLRDKLIKTV